MWTLTFSVRGVKQVEIIPADLVDELAPLVDKGRELREALAEVMVLNAQLLQLYRREQRRQRNCRKSGARRQPSKRSRR